MREGNCTHSSLAWFLTRSRASIRAFSTVSLLFNAVINSFHSDIVAVPALALLALLWLCSENICSAVAIQSIPASLVSITLAS